MAMTHFFQPVFSCFRLGSYKLYRPWDIYLTYVPLALPMVVSVWSSRRGARVFDHLRIRYDLHGTPVIAMANVLYYSVAQPMLEVWYHGQIRLSATDWLDLKRKLANAMPPPERVMNEAAFQFMQLAAGDTSRIGHFRLVSARPVEAP